MEFKKLLVPIDFSNFSKKALESAVKLARCCGGKIYLLHVEEDIFHIKMIHEIHPPLEGLTDKFHEDFMVHKKKILKKFKKYVPEDLLADAVIEEGHPFVEITKFADSHCVDLIVISERGHSKLGHVLLGSTADKVSQKTRCPVLIVKDKECKVVSEDIYEV